MTLTDVTNSNLESRKQLDDYTCGFITGIYLAKQNISQISHNKTGTGVIVKRSGRLLKLSKRDQRAVVRNFREQPFISFVEHTAKLRELKEAGINIHTQTLSIYARRNEFGSYSPASLPMLKPAQIKKRLAWAQEKMNWKPEQSRRVIWSDESKFNSSHFLPWLQNLSLEHLKEFIFQEDGASCHTGKYATRYKQRCQIQGFDFRSPQNPDLNLIEHVWAYLERRTETRRHQLKTVDQLETCLNECAVLKPDEKLSVNEACSEVRESKSKYKDKDFKSHVEDIFHFTKLITEGDFDEAEDKLNVLDLPSHIKTILYALLVPKFADARNDKPVQTLDICSCI
ncbi:hypothetical protein [Parasitella parasitica]|uniref:Transposase Tc1-like domain-containing protein n=1 Tax=Parasitella parasitica TaxID=35722 RepID=A0A0B7N2T4_9FUNG|nr:hypothetical protein [Parasitella parasitica]